ncbi:hypothetical protein WJX72_005448 [[Myrmecia] bisecta]|uniref:Fumarylacetoacetase-like C-terminal domain-containing protein n=1 Tax=[Myrmecia] bisecta TaxID=41462 RepID=A0AAW1QQG5_9CHLO
MAVLHAPKTLALQVDKLVCLGKQYAEHATELGDAPVEKPVIFNKPGSVAVVVPSQGDTIAVALPADRGVVHHEIEIVLRLRGGAIEAVTLGLDLTLRDVQTKLKKNGHAWEIGKVFPGSAVVGPWIAATDFPDYLQQEFRLEVDGTEKQRGRGRDMMMQPEESLRYIQQHFPLVDNDLVFTGTPAGVGPLLAGQLATLSWGDRLQYSVQF